MKPVLPRGRRTYGRGDTLVQHGFIDVRTRVIGAANAINRVATINCGAHMHIKLGLAAILLTAATMQPVQITSVVWKDAPATMPAGSKMAVLEGDPRHEGPFTVRVKLPAGAKVLPHFHPAPERVTVIWGEARLGFGDKFDAKKTKRFPAGSFYINPPEMHHYLYFPRTTILQITGQGPWELHYLKE